MYFPVQYEKTKEKPKLFEKNLEKTQGSQKKPRTQIWIEKPKILGENPRGSVATLKKLKTLDGPLKNPQKTPGQICKDFAEKSNFSWKKLNFFSKKSNFF